jgi:hypothetical protein
MAEETAPDVVFVYYNGKQVRLERGIVDDNPESANQMKVRLATNTSHVFLLPILNKKGRPSGAQRRIEAMPDLDLPAIGNVTDLHLKKGMRSTSCARFIRGRTSLIWLFR